MGFPKQLQKDQIQKPYVIPPTDLLKLSFNKALWILILLETSQSILWLIYYTYFPPYTQQWFTLFSSYSPLDNVFSHSKVNWPFSLIGQPIKVAIYFMIVQRFLMKKRAYKIGVRSKWQCGIMMCTDSIVFSWSPLPLIAKLVFFQCYWYRIRYLALLVLNVLLVNGLLTYLQYFGISKSKPLSYGLLVVQLLASTYILHRLRKLLYKLAGKPSKTKVRRIKYLNEMSKSS